MQLSNQAIADIYERKQACTHARTNTSRQAHTHFGGKPPNSTCWWLLELRLLHQYIGKRDSVGGVR